MWACGNANGNGSNARHSRHPNGVYKFSKIIAQCCAPEPRLPPAINQQHHCIHRHRAPPPPPSARVMIA